MGRDSQVRINVRHVGAWGRRTVLVIGAESGATTELCHQLQATCCTVVRRLCEGPIEPLAPPPDLVVIVAPTRATIARLAAEVSDLTPSAGVLAFLSPCTDGVDESPIDVGRADRVIPLGAASAYQLATIVELALDGEALLQRLRSSTREVAELLRARTSARQELEETAHALRSHASGVLLALHALRWSTRSVSPHEHALFESMRVSVEALLSIAEALPALHAVAEPSVASASG